MRLPLWSIKTPVLHMIVRQSGRFVLLELLELLELLTFFAFFAIFRGYSDL
jgi:hypothetical protein